MHRKKRKVEEYQGFEQGPIRPPSEARSLLIRVTRNCPWNHCTFCPVYKGSKFSLRPVAHVIKDIDAVHRSVERINSLADQTGRIDRAALAGAAGDLGPGESQAMNAALHFVSHGGRSIFIQDANSLIIKPRDLVEILNHAMKRFPWVERVTSYARSRTIARIKDADLKAIREAGLNRIHIGLESGSDKVLAMVKKGIDKETQIKAGLKVKKAGMELSEYVMPGLGGVELSDMHALETADALNRINPDFIRLRTLALPGGAPLSETHAAGGFHKCTDVMMARETLLFLETLGGVTSTVKSDHILNLFQEVDGVLPGDRERMIGVVRAFLDMPPEDQVIYQVGRRLGLFVRLQDMEDEFNQDKIHKICRQCNITPENVDVAIDDLMKRFI
ncbi:MAG: radical SAM protein, partial [Desulfobacterales bacterium]|nr:radical SAM protein [Desulfobacterales bacterium]